MYISTHKSGLQVPTPAVVEETDNDSSCKVTDQDGQICHLNVWHNQLHEFLNSIKSQREKKKKNEEQRQSRPVKLDTSGWSSEQTNKAAKYAVTTAATALCISMHPQFWSIMLKIQFNASTDYSHCSLPTGSSDDVGRLHSWRRHICRVEEGAVVGIVLTQGPLSSILDRLLAFQLENRTCARQCAIGSTVHTQGNVQCVGFV